MPYLYLSKCLVLAFGYIIVRDPFSWRNILGILVAMVGMLLYSYSCVLENQQKAAEAAAQAAQVCLFTQLIFLVFWFFLSQSFTISDYLVILCYPNVCSRQGKVNLILSLSALISHQKYIGTTNMAMV